MINRKDNYSEWALLISELEETQEHISNLIDELCSRENFSEVEFKIQISHIYSPLNLIYNSRNHVGEISDKKLETYLQFLADINPI